MNSSNLKKYLEYLCEENEIQYDSIIEKNFLNHIKVINIFLLFAIKIYFIVLSIISVLFFFRRFNKLSLKNVKVLLKLIFILNFIIKKIDQVLIFIYLVHLYGKEKVSELDFIENDNNFNNKFRFIVVGSGPAGSITASELSKAYPGEVLVIERGGAFNIPQEKHSGNEFYKKWYNGGINSTLFSETIAFASGNCFGGGSEINSGLYHEPDSKFLKNWTSEYGTIDLSMSSLKKFIDKVKKFTNNCISEETKFSQIFNRGKISDNEENFKLRKFIDSKNLKNSMSKTLLCEFKKNRGYISLYSNATRISYYNKKWFINVDQNGNLRTYSCEYLFLCCGSIFTNNILIKNKISKSKRSTLRKFKFHPMLKVIGLYNEKIQKLNEEIIPYQITQKNSEYIIGNASSSLQFIMSSFYSIKEINKKILNMWENMKVFHVTFSLGKGKIYNLPFFKEPILFYFFRRSEKKHMKKGVNHLLKFIKSTNPSVILPVVKNNPKMHPCDSQEKEYIFADNVKDFQISSVHILGGVTMGENKDCVADSYGKIRGYSGLYVNDSSLINTNLLKNPQGTIMAIAYRNIDNFLKNL